MPFNTRHPRRHPAFTLVELLVAIGIIAVLIGILLPVLSRARESANRTACLANIRSLDQALSLYANEYRDRVPLGHIEDEFQWDYTANFADGSSAFVTHLGCSKTPSSFRPRRRSTARPRRTRSGCSTPRRTRGRS